VTKDAAQHRSWTFYEVAKLSKYNMKTFLKQTIITAASPVAPLSCRYTYGKEDRTCFGKEEEKKHSKKRF
jgi:hypothetical protein